MNQVTHRTHSLLLLLLHGRRTLGVVDCWWVVALRVKSLCEAVYVQRIKGQRGLASWRRGHYEALELSLKSLSGDKALIFSVFPCEEAQIFFPKPKFQIVVSTFACFRWSFLDFKCFSTCLTWTKLAIHLSAWSGLTLRADSHWLYNRRANSPKLVVQSPTASGLIGRSSQRHAHLAVRAILIFFLGMFCMVLVPLSLLLPPSLSSPPRLCCVLWVSCEIGIINSGHGLCIFSRSNSVWKQWVCLRGPLLQNW